MRPRRVCKGQSRIWRPRGCEFGQSLAEFAIILLVLMLIVLGIVDLSRAVYAQSVVASAAREGARYGVISPDDTDGIKAAARNLVVGVSQDPSLFDVQVTYPYSDSDHLQVAVSYRFQPVSLLIASYIDGGSGAGLTLRARSIMRVER